MHGLSKVIWLLVVFLTVSVWTTLLYRIMSTNCCDDLEQIPLDDSPCHFFASSSR